MSNARFKLMAGLAGATLCLFAVSSYGQNTNTQTATPPAAAGTAGSVDQQQAPTTQGTQPTTTGTATTPTTTTDGSITSTATDVTTTSRTFPMWGIIAAVVVVLFILVALFRGRDRTVIRETSVSSSTSSPGNRSTGTATASDDRARAASGTGTTSGTNDPNLRR